ncbi:class I adenylate-forming enzyme family protein [Nocardioides sediminis]|uniref:class I adenylate-forming enzyme family protein n=1 Tax=Nocardioides sediminis TaxID=433648 RepID=UPI00131EE639|nr:AMP-binding protein [Nocardioides sediminis]
MVPGTLGFDLAAVAARRGDATAIRSGDREVSYAQLDGLAEQVAGRLAGEGLGRGDRVLLLTRSAIDTFALLAGAARLGAVTVPANWRLSEAELSGVVADARPALAFADASYAASLHAADGSMPVVVLDASGLDAWLDGPRDEVTVDPEGRPVLQIYTSGTSGQPKGVLLTDINLSQKVVRMGEEWAFSSESVSLLATPLFHIGGLSWGLISLAAGSTLVVPPVVSTERLRHDIENAGATHAFLVPKMLTDLVDAMASAGASTTSLEVVVCGAAPVSVALQQKASRTLGCRLVQVYGLTETTGAVTQLEASAALAAPDPEAVLRSAGRPYPWVDIEIRDPETSSPVATGSAGEIWVRSPQNCSGYWGRRDDTEALLVDGWLRTGDGGLIDADGRLHITDRLKDMIVSGGENIYSVEVERALQQHPSVRDVAIIGRPDDAWGEVVVAVVELEDGRQITLEQAAEHVASRVGRYKRPRDLVVVDALPRNTNGKILKNQIRRQLASGDSGKARP